jgi:hypothetical protein
VARPPYSRSSPKHADDAGVWVIEKLEGDGWVVAHQNDDGAMFMAIFEGQDPEVRARDCFEALRTGLLETIRDQSDPEEPPGKDEFHGDLCLIERRLTGDWFVEREDWHLTTFTGPAAERRARDYFEALKTGKLAIL